MKTLILSTEQQDKLLEMCKSFFPEYKMGFGGFYTSEVGAEYIGLDYLDITHINHKIPCIKSKFEIEEFKNDKNRFDKIEHGFVDNITDGYKQSQGFFTKDDGEIKQGSSYDEVYVEAIHWFEFCTKIGHKIFSRTSNYYNSEEFKVYSRIMLLQDKIKLNHPVDYLYEQFKKNLNHESIKVYIQT